MLIIYPVTLFLSAALMFLVQPMFGKMALPLLGGSPAVWNTQVVFCQGVLLLGYLYAHLTSLWLGIRRQAIVQCFLIFLPLLFLPIGISAGQIASSDANPVSWLLSLLFVTLGLPFFVVTTTSPILQKWFSMTPHPKAHDPYFLYAASNAGSLVGLLGYPLLLEPYLQLEGQSLLWGVGYAFLIFLTLACAVTVWKSSGSLSRSPSESPDGHTAVIGVANPGPVTIARLLRWMLGAFVPSSLMLSVTTYLTTHIAPVPLLWVLPLSIYLLSLILVFSRKTLVPHSVMVRIFPLVALAVSVVVILQATQPIGLMVVVHLASLFVIAMVCHGVVAHDRPATAHLTEFYLWVSLGGVLGGVFNVFLAPILFSSLVEYPLVLVASALLLAWPDGGQHFSYKWIDVALPAGLGALAAGLVLGGETFQWAAHPLSQALIFGLPAAVCYIFSTQPLRFGLGLGALLVASSFYTQGAGSVLHRDRTFFGVHSILVDPEERYHLLSHGGTIHGKQSLDPSRECEPLTYYHPTGPLGQMFRALEDQTAQWRVAAVGLGAGSIASYRQPGQEWTFYEVDPTVVELARDSGYFTYLSNCSTQIKVVLGDARISLAREPNDRFELLVLDAYNSDLVPIHLITQQALQLYLDKITDQGLIIFHISNQYLDLTPVVANLAQNLGLVCFLENDVFLSQQERLLGKEPSQWIIMARHPADLGDLIHDPVWQRLEGSGGPIWTDSYSSIFRLLKWNSDSF